MQNDAKYYRLAGRIFADFSGTIAIPVVLAAIVGKRLDAHQATAPRYLIIFLVFAFVLTGVMVAKKASFYKKEYELLINGK